MICLQCGYMHKSQTGSKEVFLEEVTPKPSSQEEYGKTIVAGEICQERVVGEHPVDEQQQVQTTGALNARVRAWT